MKPYRLLYAVLAVLLLASLAPAVAAQAPAPEISMAVTPAFDGNFKYGEWLPLYAEIENRGGDAKGELRVRIANTTGGVVFSVPVELAAGARKLVPIYVLPNNFTRVLDVRLVNGETLLASQQVKVRPQANVSYFVGLVTAQRGALALINGVTFPGTERPKVMVDIPLADLPERAEGLAAFNTLVINDVDTTRLTPQQAAALLAWVERGGRLVLGGGAGAQRTFAGLPPELQPVKLTGTGEAQAGQLDDLATYAGSPAIRVNEPAVLAKADAAGSRLLAGKTELPLVAERAVRRGSIDFVALDLSTAPFDGWSGTQGFWTALLTPGGSFPEGMPPDMSARQMQTSSFYGPLTNIPSLDLPSVRGLSILLGIYILLVGPVNFFILKRTRRLQLAWVSIPLITLIFTGGAFGIGYALRGNDLILNKIAMVEIQKDGPARVTSYMGLFSPRAQSYEIEVGGTSLISPANPDYGPGGPGTGVDMTFQQGQPSVVQGLSINQFSMQSFMAEDTWADFGRITGKLALENETLKGTVKNETAYTLKEAVVVINRRFQKLGDLKPGQEATVDLGLSELNKDLNGPPLSYRLYIEPLNAGKPDVYGRMPREVQQKTSILDNTFDGPIWMKLGVNPMMGLSGGPQGVTVFGWLNEAPPQVSVRGQNISQATTALAYTMLDIDMPESGRLSLPPGLLPGRLVQAPPGMGSCGPQASASIYLDNGMAAFEFQIPTTLSNFKIDNLKLSVYHDNPNAAFKGSAIYDWQKKDWVTVSTDQNGPVLISNAEPYLNENGQVQVRISAGTGNGSCYFVDLGLQAERQGQGG